MYLVKLVKLLESCVPVYVAKSALHFITSIKILDNPHAEKQ